VGYELTDTRNDLGAVELDAGAPAEDDLSAAAGDGVEGGEDELDEWARRIRGLAAEADTTHVVFNNCYSDYAHVNARQLADRLGS
jgi:hypothetical protein